MTVMNSNISWCDTSWNPWIGCHKVSAGCDNCYAEGLVNRTGTFGQRFDEVRLHLDRMSHVRRFRPLVAENGLMPRKVFVNSMSDFFVDEVPDEVLRQVMDMMDDQPMIVWMILTKRPIRARRFLTARYHNGIPRHIWIGVSAEDNRVARRLDIMRTIKERCGGGTFFTSVEPIVGPTDQLNFEGIDWVITGGESGPGARTMERAWLMPAVETAQRQGAALWHKQSGKIASHPNLFQVPARITKPADQFRWLRDNGWELLPQEKGGATIDRRTYRDLPPSYGQIADDMNVGLLRAG